MANIKVCLRFCKDNDYHLACMSEWIMQLLHFNVTSFIRLWESPLNTSFFQQSLQNNWYICSNYNQYYLYLIKGSKEADWYLWKHTSIYNGLFFMASETVWKSSWSLVFTYVDTRRRHWLKLATGRLTRFPWNGPLFAYKTK